MTIGYLMDILKKASDYICRIGEGETNFSPKEMHKIADIMSVMYKFIANTEVTEE